MAWIEQKGKSFFVRWWQGGKKRISRPIRDKYLAKQYRADIAYRHSRQELGYGDPGKTVKEALDTYFTQIEKTHKPRTVETKEYSLGFLLKDTAKLSAVTDTWVIAWRDEMMKRYAVDTVALRLRDLRAFLSWCVESKYIPKHPMTGIKIPRQRDNVGRCLTKEEIKHLLDRLPRPLKPVVVMALYTGARLSEILETNWDSIDTNRRIWHIRESKNREGRRLFLVDHVLRTLPKRQRGRMFGDYNRSTVEHQFTDTVRSAGLKGRVRFHDLRHTWASYYQGDPFSLMKNAGWKDIRMAKRYTHPSQEHLAAGMKSVSYD